MTPSLQIETIRHQFLLSPLLKSPTLPRFLWELSNFPLKLGGDADRGS
jgi:hypothetical protein